MAWVFQGLLKTRNNYGYRAKLHLVINHLLDSTTRSMKSQNLALQKMGQERLD